MIVSMCDLIPGIALIPVAILWIGVGDGAIIFMVIHAVVWPMSRSIIDGFNAVPELYLEVGRNIGLSPVKLILEFFFRQLCLEFFRYKSRLGKSVAWTYQCRNDFWRRRSFRNWLFYSGQTY